MPGSGGLADDARRRRRRVPQPARVRAGMTTAGDPHGRRRLAGLVAWVNDTLLNPPTLLSLRLGLAPRAFALLETRGRRTGLPRQTPVGNGLVGDTFWLIAQRGRE